MTIADRVQTPQKRILLCYIADGPVPLGYRFFGANNAWGYHALPARLQELISVDVFLDLMRQLLLEKLVKQYVHRGASQYAEETVYCWRATATGKRVARIFLGEDELQPGDPHHSVDGFTGFLLSKLV